MEFPAVLEQTKVVSSHVKSFMNMVNGEGRGSFITGKSVHNQRIERLWRDVYAKVLDKYYKIFYQMEESGVLDVNNPVQVSTLQYEFGPRIQEDLCAWTLAHNNHQIRTEKNKTPLQLWYSASRASSHQDLMSMNNIFRRDPDDYQSIIEQFENNLPEPANIKVILPRNPLPLTNSQLDELQNEINVLSKSDSFGVDIYGETLRFISNCVNG